MDATHDARSNARRLVVDIDDEPDEVPAGVVDNIHGIALAAGGANVVMQLSRLPVGHGVARSPVESGRVDRHPLKRLRTTVTYLMFATLGTREERLALRRQIDRVHAQVRSDADDPVPYDAFDPELQRWVAACLYKGLEDVIEVVDGHLPPPEVLDVLYEHGRRLGTTLQMPADLWPEDRDAFETYWQAGLDQVHMDDETRAYLRGIVDLGFVLAPLGPLGRPLEPLVRPIGRFMTLGFLDRRFRDELGIDLPPAADRAHRLVFRTLCQLGKALPEPLRLAPLNVFLWDARRRLRTGRRII